MKKVDREFRVVGMKNTGNFADYGREVPLSAQKFMSRLSEVQNSEGTEIALFEPKKDENHLEGNYYVGVMVDDAKEAVPAGMEYIELAHEYVTARGKISRIGELHKDLLIWAKEEGYERDLEVYIVETYHPQENGEEEVEIFLPVQTV